MIGELPVYNDEYDREKGFLVQVMFDTGSDSSFIERDVAKKMALQRVREDVCVRTIGFGGNEKNEKCEKVAIHFDVGRKRRLKVEV